MVDGRRGSAAVLLALLVMLASCSPVAQPTPKGAVRGAGNAGRLTLATSAARTAAFTGDAVTVTGYRLLVIELDVTAVSGTTPTLDVKVQTLVDGTNWCDIAAFTQATAATRQLVRISQETTPNAQVACTDGTLAAGTIHQGPWGQSIRVKHALPGGTTPSFTYSVTAWASE